MNNAITEIKSNLKGTNNRITEAEERISQVEDRTMEINEADRKKESKEKRRSSDTTGTMLNAQHSNDRCLKRRRQKERA